MSAIDFDALGDEEFMEQSYGADVLAAQPDVPDEDDEIIRDAGDTLEESLMAPAPAAKEDENEDTVASVSGDDHTTPKQTKADDAVSGDDSIPAGTAEDEDEDDEVKNKALTDPDPDAAPAPAPEAKAAENEDGAAPVEAAAPENFEELYNQIMKPFKANGRDFKPASPDEAVRLMQMGANYTKKMQALAPNLKLMKMLENNGLLQESKLNLLIDLDQKKPEAIQKFLKDAQIDPLDLDLNNDTVYQPSNHAVSDDEMAFHDTLADVLSTPTGKETVNLIDTQWDRASKEIIYADPKVLAIINTQRENGIFDQISTEIDRRKTLGDLSNVPFIHAYKQVGDYLHETGALGPAAAAPQGNPAPVTTQAPQVLEVRTAPRKQQMSNGDRAKATSPGPSTQQSAPKVEHDPFSMTDAEIMAATSPKV